MGDDQQEAAVWSITAITVNNLWIAINIHQRSIILDGKWHEPSTRQRLKKVNNHILIGTWAPDPTKVAWTAYTSGKGDDAPARVDSVTDAYLVLARLKCVRVDSTGSKTHFEKACWNSKNCVISEGTWNTIARRMGSCVVSVPQGKGRNRLDMGECLSKR